MAITYEGINLVRKFYQALTDTSNTLALTNLWLVKIDRADFEAVFEEEIVPVFQLYEGIKWDFFDAGKKTFEPQWFAGESYFFLAQGCTFPGDSWINSHVGVDKTGLLKGPIGNMRNNLSNVTITFLETNQSIADLVFRPWALMVGHKSLKHMPLRKNIELVALQKGGLENSLKIRKRLVLEKACPFEVDQEEYNYLKPAEAIQRQIQFIYNRYHIIAPNENIQGTNKDVYQQIAAEKGLLQGDFLDFVIELFDSDFNN